MRSALVLSPQYKWVTRGPEVSMKQFVQSAAVGHSKWQNQASKADWQVLTPTPLSPLSSCFFLRGKWESEKVSKSWKPHSSEEIQPGLKPEYATPKPLVPNCLLTTPCSLSVSNSLDTWAIPPHFDTSQDVFQSCIQWEVVYKWPQGSERLQINFWFVKSSKISHFHLLSHDIMFAHAFASN